MIKIVIGLLVGTILVGIIIYVGYSYSQKIMNGNKVALPAGQNYLGENAPNYNGETPPTAPQRFTAATDVAWTEFKGTLYPYSFKYPETLTLGVFPNDPSDGVAIVWGNIPPQSNILLNVEKDKLQSNNTLEEYVNNWWKSYSGLKGVKSVTKFTNTSGLVGYRAIYINSADQTPNVDIFLQVPQDNTTVIRLANGILDSTIFDRIVDSVKYTSGTSKVTPSNP